MYFIFHDTIPAVSSNAFTFFTYKPHLNKTSSMACAPVGQYGQFGYLVFALAIIASLVKISSRKHLRTKVTPDFHLSYSKNGGNLGSESK